MCKETRFRVGTPRIKNKILNCITRRESLLRFLERSVMAVRGLVVDLAGQPAGQATVIFKQV